MNDQTTSGRGPLVRLGLLAVVTALLSLMLAAPANAQTVSTIADCDIVFGDVDALDFIDPITGDLDQTGYLVVLQASNSAVTVINAGNLTVCVAGLQVGSQLTIVLDGTTVLFDGPYNLNTALTDVDWQTNLMALSLTLPDLPCGPHNITATGTTVDGEPFSQTYNFEVTGCPDPNLPVTGSDTGRLVGIAAALVVLGAGMYYGARQRQSTVI